MLTAVHLDLAVVVLPRHAELELALRLHQTLQNAVRLVLRMRLQGGGQRRQDLKHRLLELRLARIALGNNLQDAVHIRIVRHRLSSVRFEGLMVVLFG